MTRAALLALALLALSAAPAQAIVGGRTVSESAYPWFATLPDCGGSLVAPDRIVTAAHCVSGLRLSDLGAIRLAGGQRVAVSRMAVAPGYVRRERAGDTRAGGTLSCAAASQDLPADEVLYRWTSYRFQRGSVVRQQSASATYTVRPADAQRVIFCTAVGYTAGGGSESRASAGTRIAA